MLKKLFWPVLIIFSAVLAGIFVWSNSGGILRSILLFWFILICPGMALIRLLQLKDLLSEWVLAVVLSLVLSALVAEFMVVTHLWSPPTGLAVLIGISLMGAALQIIKAFQLNMATR
jgi:hypothetical protein